MNANNPANVRMLAAVIGSSAVVAMGAVTMAITTHDQGVPAEMASSGMTVGATTKQETPPPAPATSIAVPTLKAVPFGGAGS
jgi:hypothetical protein